MTHNHGGGAAPEAIRGAQARIALVGAPNGGKTSVFNALTGLRAKTGNYPGVTVARAFGTVALPAGTAVIEDLPGTYGLDPVSPDEQVVVDVIAGSAVGVERPDALACVVDATTLRRSLDLVAQVLSTGLPVCIVLTLTDELVARGGAIDPDGLAVALGVPVVPVIGNRGIGIGRLRDALATWRSWPRPPIDPPVDAAESTAWIEAVLAAAAYRSPGEHRATQRADAVLLHPVWGTLVFFAVMFTFFQVIFTIAAPAQDLVSSGFAWLAQVVHQLSPSVLIGDLLGNAVIGGVGGVLVFLPQIALLFFMISLLEQVGYLARAAFLMDRVMARFGLEGRAFVALLSSVACAIPGIMAARTLPSAKDRIATMVAAPYMTCSARLPVYILLIGILVSPDARFGPIGAQGAVLFALYLFGAVAAMIAAAISKRVTTRGELAMPFTMELPPYRLPRPKAVLFAMWDSARTFVRKAGTIILLTTIVLWALLNFPAPSNAQLRSAHVDPADSAAVATYTMNHSWGAAVGHAVQPVFAPLGFDWRVTVGVLSAQSARETFVATLGQVAAAENPDDPAAALRAMRYDSGPAAGTPVFTAPTIVALLVWFALALQCMSTVAVMRRESGGWRVPVVAWTSSFAVAWLCAFAAHAITQAVVG